MKKGSENTKLRNGYMKITMSLWHFGLIEIDTGIALTTVDITTVSGSVACRKSYIRNLTEPTLIYLRQVNNEQLKPTTKKGRDRKSHN